MTDINTIEKSPAEGAADTSSEREELREGIKLAMQALAVDRPPSTASMKALTILAKLIAPPRD